MISQQPKRAKQSIRLISPMHYAMYSKEYGKINQQINERTQCQQEIAIDYEKVRHHIRKEKMKNSPMQQRNVFSSPLQGNIKPIVCSKIEYDQVEIVDDQKFVNTHDKQAQIQQQAEKVPLTKLSDADINALSEDELNMYTHEEVEKLTKPRQRQFYTRFRALQLEREKEEGLRAKQPLWPKLNRRTDDPFRREVRVDPQLSQVEHYYPPAASSSATEHFALRVQDIQLVNTLKESHDFERYQQTRQQISADRRQRNANQEVIKKQKYQQHVQAIAVRPNPAAPVPGFHSINQADLSQYLPEDKNL